MNEEEKKALDDLIRVIRMKSREEGFEKGYKKGYEEGLEEGAKQYTVGFQDAKEVYMVTIRKND